MKQPIGGGEAEVVVEGGHEVPGASAAGDAVLTALVAGADDAAGLDAAAGPEVRERARPVVATGLHGPLGPASHAAAAARHARDARGAPELACDADEHLLVHAALINVLD